ncbi:MAG: transporter [Burkholderiales bacterium]
MVTKYAALLVGVVGALFLSSQAYCADATPKSAEQRILQLMRKLDEQEKRMAQQQLSLEEQERRLLKLKKELQQTLEERQVPKKELQTQQATGTPPKANSKKRKQASEPPVAVAAQEAEDPVGQAPESRPPEIAPIFDEPGVLTPRGQLVLEPSLQYSHSSDNRVALVGFTIIPAITIGLIDVRSVNRDTFIAALTARYGVTNMLEVEGKLPYVYRDDSTLARPLATPTVADSAFDSDGSGIGDIELAARYQFNVGGPNRPYYIGTLRFKARTGEDPFEVDIDPTTNLQRELPTGTGFYGLQPGLTAIFPSDPAVFFGGVSYLWNIERDVGGGFGDVDPGDAVGVNFGMGLALNEKASFSIGYEHSTFTKDEQNGRTVQQAQTRQVGTLLLGYSYRVTEKTNFNLILGAGLTDEAPDVQVTVRVPTFW